MNIGLVLSGGLAKGAYQIGALQAINEFVPREEIKYISCASIGVLNGYAYATDNLACAQSMWKNVCTDDMRLFVGHILRSAMLQQNIKSLYRENQTLSSSFYEALFDINHRNITYKDLTQVASELIPLYLKASVAIPFFNRSVPINGSAYFDGAIVDNIPVYPLLQHNLDYILCIYFDDACYKFENEYFDSKIIKISFSNQKRATQSLFCETNEIDAMIDMGYKQTKHLLNYVFAKGYDNLEYIYSAIRYLNRGSGSSFRITTDVLITNLNKITQKLTKRNIL